MKPRALTIRGLILGGSRRSTHSRRPIALVREGFALAPWLGMLGFVGATVFLYAWMLRRSAATP